PPGFPAGGYFSVHLPSGRISVTILLPGEDHVTTLVVEGRDLQIDRKAGSAFQFIPAFIDTNGNEYQPSTVHTKVVMRETGAEIIAMTEVLSWEMGDPIIAPGAWTELVNPN